MTTRHLVGFTLLALLTLAYALYPGATPARANVIFTVDDTADAVDTLPGNGLCQTAGGNCSLRAAIQEANAFAGDDTIIVPAGSYSLTLTGMAEDAGLTGDLDIASSLVISASSNELPEIRGDGDRVFQITGTVTVT